MVIRVAIRLVCVVCLKGEVIGEGEYCNLHVRVENLA